MIDRSYVHHQCQGDCCFVFLTEVIPEAASGCPCGGEFYPVDPSDTPHKDKWADWCEIDTRQYWDELVDESLQELRADIDYLGAALKAARL